MKVLLQDSPHRNHRQDKAETRRWMRTNEVSIERVIRAMEK